MVNLTAGKPRLDAYLKYGGNFERYWEKIASQRAGKTFEAMLAHSGNARLADLGKGERFVVTAVEGAGTHPADLLLRSEDDQIVTHYQAKLGWRAATASLDEPKYAGKLIATTQNSYHIIERDLRSAEEAAVRRGIVLNVKWRIVSEALENDRLLRELVPGLALPTRQEVEYVAWRTAEARWRGLATIADNKLETAASAAEVGRGGGLRLGGKVAARTFFVIDVFATAEQTYRDAQRFGRGEIDTGDLSIKLGIRGANISLAYTMAFDPEPATKVVAAICLMMVVGVDAAHDAIIDARARAARRLLGSIDHEERVQAVRRQMLNEIRQIAEQ